ncbi:HAD family hydrolase [Nocardia sp. NBC_00511]|uniref:HAD family hydrolase n=1 Tax=Nocardia sp. NBC_00511 TaxID=2903591 RepID=UPI0030E1999E
MSARIDAVLFDLDGTLVATMGPWDRCWEQYAARHGHVWCDADRNSTHGHGDWACHLARVSGGLPVEQVVEDCCDLMIARVRAGRIGLLPGAQGLLTLAASTVAVAVVSASPRRFVDATLAHYGLRMPTVVTREDQTATKPHPAPYLHAAQLLDVHPQHCVAVEDSAAGIRSAHTAGMRVLAVPSWSAALRPPELDLATHHAPSAVEALPWLRSALAASAEAIPVDN